MRSSSRAGIRRRPRLAALFALLVLVTVPGCAGAEQVSPGPGSGGYLGFADRMQGGLDRLWDEAAGRYRSGERETEAMLNGNLLLTHAVAALKNHCGPARNDHRARLIARTLVSGPAFAERLPPSFEDPQRHAPGFVDTMEPGERNQHLVIDAEIVDGLTHAWLARRELGLPADTARLIADRIHRVARGRFYRWPAIRLNQVNWYALLYAADATVTGDPELLRTDLAAQLRRFFRRPRPTAAAAGNFGPGLHFHYLPHRPVDHFMNLDSPEYANIVASFTRFYEQARRAGMPALGGAERRLARRWLTRLLAGYWTHGGYLNWDTGFGFERWHQAKKLGLSQQALIGIASSPSLAPHPRARGWAKWLLDRGLALYERTARAAPDGIAPGLFFGVSAVPEGIGSVRLAAARIQSNAARAAAAGLDRIRAVAPPPVYSFDPDNGRLAVSTPAYNTAIVPVNRGAFPYGGIELARFFDGDQRPAGGIGGRPPASFGVLVRDGQGRDVLATQLAKRPGGVPLRLSQAPHGVGAHAASAAPRAYAGRFRELRATGSVSTATMTARTSHRFTASSVETRWEVRSRGGGANTVDVLFPSWGRASATVWAVRRDGSRAGVAAGIRGGARVAYFHVRSAHSGYVVVPVGHAPFTVHTLRPERQSTAPNPGPTLVVRLADHGRFRRLTFAARLAPARTAAQAARVAARLASEDAARAD